MHVVNYFLREGSGRERRWQFFDIAIVAGHGFISTVYIWESFDT
jgi:hypothetical protein